MTRRNSYQLYIAGELRTFKLKRTAMAAWRKAKRAGQSVWSADHVDAHGDLRPGFSKKERERFYKHSRGVR